mmetsp:Transcript_4681/g.11324  ORF Transcript_4681/g.11324 Transcript_4681/m.11324 type:complete len:201 (+) Transcript_4681:237-839(+)
MVASKIKGSAAQVVRLQDRSRVYRNCSHGGGVPDPVQRRLPERIFGHRHARSNGSNQGPVSRASGQVQRAGTIIGNRCQVHIRNLHKSSQHHDVPSLRNTVHHGGPLLVRHVRVCLGLQKRQHQVSLPYILRCRMQRGHTKLTPGLVHRSIQLQQSLESHQPPPARMVAQLVNQGTVGTLLVRRGLGCEQLLEYSRSSLP